MTPDSDDIALLLRQLVASIGSHANARLEQHGLTQAQWRPLLIAAHGAASTSTELARLLGIDHGAMCRTLHRLERKQLCRPVRCGEDRRVVRIEVTELGRQACRLATQEIAVTMQTHLAGFDAIQVQTLRTLLRQALANGQLAEGENPIEIAHEHHKNYGMDRSASCS